MALTALFSLTVLAVALVVSARPLDPLLPQIPRSTVDPQAIFATRSPRTLERIADLSRLHALDALVLPAPPDSPVTEVPASPPKNAQKIIASEAIAENTENAAHEELPYAASFIILAASCIAALVVLACLAAALFAVRCIRLSKPREQWEWEMVPRHDKWETEENGDEKVALLDDEEEQEEGGRSGGSVSGSDGGDGGSIIVQDDADEVREDQCPEEQEWNEARLVNVFDDPHPSVLFDADCSDDTPATAIEPPFMVTDSPHTPIESPRTPLSRPPTPAPRPCTPIDQPIRVDSPSVHVDPPQIRIEVPQTPPPTGAMHTPSPNSTADPDLLPLPDRPTPYVTPFSSPLRTSASPAMSQVSPDLRTPVLPMSAMVSPVSMSVPSVAPSRSASPVPPSRQVQMREAGIGPKPAWSRRAADSPALGLRPDSPAPIPRPASPALRIPGTLVPESRSQDNALTVPMSADPTPPRQRQRIYRAPVPELDIAFAMQLRPGLGLGADAAWLVRFLMAMFGWMSVIFGAGAGMQAQGRERRRIIAPGI